jgi:hypothetical protein
MHITAERLAAALPRLEDLVLTPDDLPGFRRVFADAASQTNEAVAARADDPEQATRRLHKWGRIDGFAARYLPLEKLLPTQPIVIDTSAARFHTAVGAMQALTDESAFPMQPGASRLFPRNIADATECLHLVFEEEGERFSLYRVDFRVCNLLGSVGVVWRWPHGGPLQALRLAERQAFRMRTALNIASSHTSSAKPVDAERKERQLYLMRKA